MPTYRLTFLCPLRSGTALFAGVVLPLLIAAAVALGLNVRPPRHLDDEMHRFYATASYAFWVQRELVSDGLPAGDSDLRKRFKGPNEIYADWTDLRPDVENLHFQFIRLVYPAINSHTRRDIRMVPMMGIFWSYRSNTGEYVVIVRLDHLGFAGSNTSVYSATEHSSTLTQVWSGCSSDPEFTRLVQQSFRGSTE